MNEAITLSSLGQMLGLLTIIAGLWWRVETRISQGAVDAMARANAAMAAAEEGDERIHALRLEVAENYAKMALIKDIENGILTELRGLRKDFHEAVVKMASTPTARKRA